MISKQTRNRYEVAIDIGCNVQLATKREFKQTPERIGGDMRMVGNNVI